MASKGVVSRRTTCASITCASRDKECVEEEDRARCRCKKGLREEGSSCVDIDECVSGQFNCVQHSYCMNKRGTYLCVCSEGYRKQDDKCMRIPDTCPYGSEVVNGTCKDVDECLRGTHKCPD